MKKLKFLIISLLILSMAMLSLSACSSPDTESGKTEVNPDGDDSGTDDNSDTDSDDNTGGGDNTGSGDNTGGGDNTGSGDNTGGGDSSDSGELTATKFESAINEIVSGEMNAEYFEKLNITIDFTEYERTDADSVFVEQTHGSVAYDEMNFSIDRYQEDYYEYTAGTIVGDKYSIYFNDPNAVDDIYFYTVEQADYEGYADIGVEFVELFLLVDTDMTKYTYADDTYSMTIVLQEGDATVDYNISLKFDNAKLTTLEVTRGNMKKTLVISKLGTTSIQIPDGAIEYQY